MFEGATAVDISVARTPAKKRESVSSPSTVQFHDFDFQAKISHLLTDSAKKGPRVGGSEAPSFMGGMRRSRSSESLDTASKPSGAAAPTLEPIQQSPQLTSIAAAVDPAPLSSSGGLHSDSPPAPSQLSRQDSSPAVAAAAAAAAAAASPAAAAAAPAAAASAPLSSQPKPQELAVQLFAACGWDSQVAAACLVEALAHPNNPSLSSGKFQQAGAKFANEITSSIMWVVLTRPPLACFARLLISVAGKSRSSENDQIQKLIEQDSHRFIKLSCPCL